MLFRPEDPSHIAWLLSMHDKAVKAAIVAIYNRQTTDEKRNHCVTHKNYKGFRANHGVVGTHLAKLILGGRDLTAMEMLQARGIALHYIKQLASIATEKLFQIGGEDLHEVDLPEEDMIKFYKLHARRYLCTLVRN